MLPNLEIPNFLSSPLKKYLSEAIESDCLSIYAYLIVGEGLVSDQSLSREELRNGKYLIWQIKQNLYQPLSPGIFVSDDPLLFNKIQSQNEPNRIDWSLNFFGRQAIHLGLRWPQNSIADSKKTLVQIDLRLLNRKISRKSGVTNKVFTYRSPDRRLFLNHYNSIAIHFRNDESAYQLHEGWNQRTIHAGALSDEMVLPEILSEEHFMEAVRALGRLFENIWTTGYVPEDINLAKILGLVKSHP